MNRAAKIVGVAAVVATIASPLAMAQFGRFGGLRAFPAAQANPNPIATQAINITRGGRADFFALLGRDDPRSPN